MLTFDFDFKSPRAMRLDNSILNCQYLIYHFSKYLLLTGIFLVTITNK